MQIDESLIANSVGSALEWDSVNKLINVRVDGSTILIDGTNNWLKVGTIDFSQVNNRKLSMITIDTDLVMLNYHIWLKSLDADNTNTARWSPNLYFRGAYWDGTQSVEKYIRQVLVVSSDGWNALKWYDQDGNVLMQLIGNGSGNLWIDGGFYPFSDASQDLGSSSYRWRDGYFSGTLLTNNLVKVSKSSGYAFLDMERSDIPQHWSLRITDSGNFYLYNVTDSKTALLVYKSGDTEINGKLNLAGDLLMDDQHQYIKLKSYYAYASIHGDPRSGNAGRLWLCGNAYLDSGGTWHLWDTSYDGLLIGLIADTGAIGMWHSPSGSSPAWTQIFNLDGSGNMWILGDLQIKGNDIKDNSGTTRITLGDPLTINAGIKPSSNNSFSVGDSSYWWNSIYVINYKVPQAFCIRYNHLIAYRDLKASIYHEYGDLLRFRTPISVEYYDFGTGSWTSWDQDFSNVLDGRHFDTYVTIDYDHRKFRLTFDLGATYRHIMYVLVSGEYPSRNVTVTIEVSSDQSTWTQIYSGTVYILYRGIYIPDSDIGSRRYIRFTFEVDLDSGETWPFKGLSLYSERADPTTKFPFSWDFNKNVTIGGDLKINGNDIKDSTGAIRITMSSTNTKITTDYGYVQLGPQNDSYCHFLTDRGKFYFNKHIVLNGDLIRYTNDSYLIISGAFGGQDYGAQIVLYSTGYSSDKGSMRFKITYDSDIPNDPMFWFQVRDVQTGATNTLMKLDKSGNLWINGTVRIWDGSTEPVTPGTGDLSVLSEIRVGTSSSYVYISDSKVNRGAGGTLYIQANGNATNFGGIIEVTDKVQIYSGDSVAVTELIGGSTAAYGSVIYKDRSGQTVNIWEVDYRVSTPASRCMAWYWKDSSGNWYYRMYLTTGGSLYIDGSYNTYSPKIADTEDELIRDIRRIVNTPPAPRDESGRILHPVKRVPIDDMEEGEEKRFGWFVLERAFSKDIGKIALSSGKLLLKLYNRVKYLEGRVNELEKELSVYRNRIAE